MIGLWSGKSVHGKGVCCIEGVERCIRLGEGSLL